MSASAHAFILLDILVGFILQDFVSIEFQVLGRDRIVATRMAGLNRSCLPVLFGGGWNVAMRVGVGAHALIRADILVGVIVQDHVLVEFMVSLGGWTVATSVIVRHGRWLSWGVAWTVVGGRVFRKGFVKVVTTWTLLMRQHSCSTDSAKPKRQKAGIGASSQWEGSHCRKEFTVGFGRHPPHATTTA